MYILFVKAGVIMQTQIKKIGNSKGVIIPASILKVLNIHENDVFEIVSNGHDIILTKIMSFEPKSLEALFEGYHGIYQQSIVFDDDQGREIW
jgi:antitoxin component of MazEF toxin-antitoxin module